MKVRAQSRHLFRRAPDKTFGTLDDLAFHCSRIRHTSRHCWETPARLTITSDLKLMIGEAELALNDWSFGQLCRLAGLDKATLNRLTPRMASHVIQRMLSRTDRPWEFLATWGTARAIHGLSYSRLWNCELISVLREIAPVWRPPHSSAPSGSLICGEQDLFCFLTDAAGAVEIDGDEFAPGFVVWNSEVGSRPLGIQAFWYQRGCQNHLLWDPVRTQPFVRKHVGDIRQSCERIRIVVEALDRQSNQRRDEFARVVRKAKRLRLGKKEEAFTQLSQLGIARRLARESLELADRDGRLTIFAVTDAITRLSQAQQFADKRAALDKRAASLLALAT